MTQEQILSQLQSGKLSVQEAQALLGKQSAPPATLTYKVSRKGAISLYGLSQWPVTLYVDQWERLFSGADTFQEFVQTWEGKDYEGSGALTKGGPQVPYKARITRKCDKVKA